MRSPSDKIADDAARAKYLKKEDITDTLRIESLVFEPPAALDATRPKPRNWLLRDSRKPNHDGVFPLGKVGMLVAEGGAGKTMALIQLALAIASGSKWLDVFSVRHPGRVLFLLGEEDQEELHRRLYAASGGRVTRSDGTIVSMPLAGIPCSFLSRSDRGAEPSTSGFATALLAYAAANGPWDLVCVDPLSRFAGLDAETDNASATRFVQTLEALATATGASVLVSHHTAKVARGGGEVSSAAARGSTGLTDGTRWVATLSVQRGLGGTEDAEARERIGEVVKFVVSKNNYALHPEPVLLRRAEGGRLVPLDKADRELVAVASDAGAMRRSAKDADRTERAARQLAERAAREAERAAASSSRVASEDAALRAVLAAQPGINGIELRMAMKLKLEGCSHSRTDLAVRRCASWIRFEEGGPRGAILHYLREVT